MSVFDQWNGFIASDQQDDTGRLIAYRLRMGGRASNCWAVSLNGQHLASIVDDSSKWVHDNWDITFVTRFSSGIERDPNFVQIMTTKNREYLTSMLKKLIGEIKRAKSRRSADVVALPIEQDRL